jgi:radical SAM superfamily enzyme YgiQ (UPF0313 family)
MDYPFELGPIRPVDEADSLLIRTTRGCPWNRCDFCVNFKSSKFSVRSIKDIKKDIEAAADYYDGHPFRRCFLQDGDSLIMKTAEVIEIINCLKHYFPTLEIISSYGRAQSMIKKSLPELKELCQAGLNLLYCGMESGSDSVLKLINKGVTASNIITAGVHAKEAGMQLSEFIILGLGGMQLWQEHARETANVLNSINPDKIRVLTIGIKPGSGLEEKWNNGSYVLQTEEEIIEEQRLLVSHLDDSITSHYANHHSVDLLLEVRGQLPDEKSKLISILDRFLSLSKEDKQNFILGRRFSIYQRLDDQQNPSLFNAVEQKRQTLGHPNTEQLESIFHLLRSRIV